MAIANTNTSNSGAFNGSVYQELKGIRTFANLLGAPKFHKNTEFPLNTSYTVGMSSETFTETTENDPTTPTHQDFTNDKNTFTFFKDSIEISQTALNSAMHIADANVLAEVGADYFLTDAFQAQTKSMFQRMAKKYNNLLINSTYTEFTPTANSTRGLIEAAQLYPDTSLDLTLGVDGIGIVEGIEEVLLAMMAEGVTTEVTPSGLNSNMIDGTQGERAKNIRLTLLSHPSTRHYIEKQVRATTNPMFEIVRSRTEAGTELTLIVTSFGNIEFKMDEDMPVNACVIARFGEMNPVFQPNNPIGREGGNRVLSPDGAIIYMVEDMKRSQGVGVEAFVRVGLDYGPSNRIGYLGNVGPTPPMVDTKFNSTTPANKKG